MTIPRIGNYHAVTPGRKGPEPETFREPGLPGLLKALAYATGARDGVPRTVTRVSGRDATTVCTITDGIAAWPPGRDIVPARKTPRKGQRS